VLRDDFHILVAITTVQLVLDAKVREVDPLIEVRELVFVRPPFDLSGVTIRPPVAVGSAAIRLLQPLLILALELILEDDSANIGALVAEPFVFADVRAIDLYVVGQLAGAADARVERLLAPVLSVATMALQKVATALCERDSALAAHLHEFREPFIAKMA
jgi:hypothetical protein